MTTRGKIHTSISALIGLLVILFLVTPAQAQGFKTKYESKETKYNDFFKSKIETKIIYKFGG